MERRKFMQQSLLAGGALVSSATGLAASANSKIGEDAKPFKCNYGFHNGMFKNHAGPDFIDQIKFGHSMGFRSIEDNGMMSRKPEEQSKIGETLSKLGMDMGVFVIEYDKWPLQISMTSGKKEWRDKFVQYCKDAVEVAKRCNAKWMTVVPGNYERKLTEHMQMANVIDMLRAGTEVLEKHGLVMVLEPLSDTPELFLRRSDQTYAICRAINSRSCKILYIIKHIEQTWDEIGYFQIGDNPGRKEPGTGEMNYQNIFKYIHCKGYKGVYGMEHGNAQPGKEGELALIKAYREADSF
jgi:hydroxypyruvate isomerase